MLSPLVDQAASHPQYNAYHEDVLLVLQSFDKCVSCFRWFISSYHLSIQRASDWADFIDLLTRLGAVFRRYPQFPSLIPSIFLCGKRLSQCLNPALPSGVHMKVFFFNLHKTQFIKHFLSLKALEIYQLIFSRISHTGLAKYIHIFSSGLFPLSQYASTNVRGLLMDIFESEYLRLGKELSLCLSGFIVAVLPGLEDETSVFHSRTMRLLSKTEVVFQYLFSKFFILFNSEELIECISFQRYGDLFVQTLQLVCKLFTFFCLVFLNQVNFHQDNLENFSLLNVEVTESFTFFKSLTFLSIVLKSIYSCLTDPNILVQRNALDVLTQHCPFTSDSLYGSDEKEWCATVEAALLLLLRRETSLTRRITTWIFGPNPETENYFQRYSCPKVILAFQLRLNQCSRLSLSVDTTSSSSEIPGTKIEKGWLLSFSFTFDSFVVF